MFSREQPSLTGLAVGGDFTSLTAKTVGIGTSPIGGNALTVVGNTSLYGSLSATSLTGCMLGGRLDTMVLS